MICPHCGAKLPDGLQACFRCGEPLDAAPPPPEQHAYVAGRAYAKPVRKPRGKIAAVIAIVIILAIGTAAVGHYIGLYSLPILPAVSDTADSGDTTALAPSVSGADEPTEPGTSMDLDVAMHPVEEGYHGASFTRSEDDLGVSEIHGIAVMFEESWEGELIFSDFSNFVLIKDSEEIPAYFDETVERGTESGSRNDFFLDFVYPLTAPGTYTFSFDLRGYHYADNEVLTVSGGVSGSDPQGMEARVSVPHISISVDQSNPRHAIFEMSGFELPDWIYEAGPESEQPTGISWTVFFSSDGRELFAMTASRWCDNNEEYSADSYGITVELHHYTDLEYNENTATSVTTRILAVGENSISWECALAGDHLDDFDLQYLDLNNLQYVGYEVEEYNIRPAQTNTYVFTEGEWRDWGEVPMPTFFKDNNA